MKRLLSAQEACERLQISPASLYAYVSRGRVRSEALPGERRRGYLAEDIQRLQDKKSVRRQPEQAGARALDWGLGLMPSAISQIDDGQLRYRQTDLNALLDQPLEQVIALLWAQDRLELPTWSFPVFPAPQLLEGLAWFEALQIQLAWYAQQDLQALDLSAEGLQRSCQRLLAWIWCQATGRQNLKHPLISNFELPDAARQRLCNRLLVVSAEHELNISSFTARCVASARSSPHAAIQAALAALSGQRHGGQTRQVYQLWQLCQQRGGVASGLRSWWQQHQHLPGVGHRLYPAGDPRWQAIAELLARDFAPPHPLSQQARHWLDFADQLQRLSGQPPNLDLALVAGAELLGLPEREALDWFALGRLSGWLAQIQEQYARPELIRPRAG